MEIISVLALLIILTMKIVQKAQVKSNPFNALVRTLLQRKLTPKSFAKQQKKMQEQSARRERFLGEARAYMTEFNCKFYDPNHHSYLVNDIPLEDIQEVHKNIELSERYWQEAKFDKAADFADFAAQSAAFLLTLVNFAISIPPNQRPTK